MLWKYSLCQLGKCLRVEFFGDEIDRITEIDVVTGEIIGERKHVSIFPLPTILPFPKK